MTDKDDKLIFEAYLQEKFERDAAIDTIANLVSTPRNDKVIISNIQMILAGMTAEEKYDVLINLHGKVNDDMYTRMIEGDLYRLFVPDSVQSAAPKQPESVPSDDIPQDMGEISNVNEPVETHDNNLNQIQNYFLQKLQQVIEDSSYVKGQPGLIPKYISYKAQDTSETTNTAHPSSINIELLWALTIGGDGPGRAIAVKNTPVLQRMPTLTGNNLDNPNMEIKAVLTDLPDPESWGVDPDTGMPFEAGHGPPEDIQRARRLLFYKVTTKEQNLGEMKIEVDHKGRLIMTSVNEVLNKIIQNIISALDQSHPNWRDFDPPGPMKPFWGDGPEPPSVFDK